MPLLFAREMSFIHVVWVYGAVLPTIWCAKTYLVSARGSTCGAAREGFASRLSAKVPRERTSFIEGRETEGKADGVAAWSVSHSQLLVYKPYQSDQAVLKRAASLQSTYRLIAMLLHAHAHVSHT